jgi:hypothetical protein
VSKTATATGTGAVHNPAARTESYRITVFLTTDHATVIVPGVAQSCRCSV